MAQSALVTAALTVWEDAVAGGDSGQDVFSISRASLVALALAVADETGASQDREFATLLRDATPAAHDHDATCRYLGSGLWDCGQTDQH